MTKVSSIVLLAAASAIFVSMNASSQDTYVPPNGFVPDAATATRIAEAVWIPIYGEAHIAARSLSKPRLKAMFGQSPAETCRHKRWAVSPRPTSPGEMVEFSASFTVND